MSHRCGMPEYLRPDEDGREKSSDQPDRPQCCDELHPCLSYVLTVTGWRDGYPAASVDPHGFLIRFGRRFCETSRERAAARVAPFPTSAWGRLRATAS